MFRKLSYGSNIFYFLDDESTATEGEVQDGAGEGPSEHVMSADELDKEGEVQITVPQQMDKIWKANDYQTLNSNVETGILVYSNEFFKKNVVWSVIES